MRTLMMLALILFLFVIVPPIWTVASILVALVLSRYLFGMIDPVRHRPVPYGRVR
jgi:hypothetical protein